MSFDISNKLELAHSIKSSWNKAVFLELCEEIASCLNADLDWDEGAGEHWAAIRVEDLAVRVNALVPFAFVHSKYRTILDRIFIKYKTVTLCVEDFDSPDFFISSKDKLEVLGGDKNYVPPEENFSANDIWFDTV